MLRAVGKGMKVLLKEAFQTNQSHGSCVFHPGSQSLSSTLSAFLELLIPQLLVSKNQKMIQLGPEGGKIMMTLPFMVCFPQTEFALPII